LTLSFVGHGDEYYETIDKIAKVLRKHMKPFNPKFPKVDAYEFRSAYLVFLDNFWSREEANVALENLSRALQNVSTSYEAVPVLVKDTIVIEADVLDVAHKDGFLKNTKAEVLHVSSLPTLGAREAAKALEVLVKQKEALLSAIRVVQRELPEGIPTRNRPSKAWAVIHAADEISNEGKKINVPKAIDQAGPFYRLLCDLFELFEIEETVQGAFRGWRKHMDGKFENLDLMPI
jgi:hypothetical protein